VSRSPCIHRPTGKWANSDASSAQILQFSIDVADCDLRC
jgi:hypothetical protein